MYLGLLLLSFGATILFDLGYLAGIVGSLGIFIPKIGKARVTYPRLGFIKFRKTRKKSMSFILLGILVLGVVLFFLFIGGQDSPLTQFLKKNILFVIASIWGGAIVFAAACLEVKRFFLYAVLVFLGIVLADWIGSLGINLLMVGLFLIIIGVVVMIQFIRRYPIIPDEEA